MTDIAALAARIDRLEHELGIQQDIHQIRRIQYSYGYFIDKSQYNEVVDLFSDDGEVWFLGGIYKGKAGVRRLYIERFRGTFTQGHNGPRYGWLLDHPQLQMVIDVADDRKTAKVRGRSMMQAGLHETAEGQQRAADQEIPTEDTQRQGGTGQRNLRGTSRQGSALRRQRVGVRHMLFHPPLRAPQRRKAERRVQAMRVARDERKRKPCPLAAG